MSRGPSRAERTVGAGGAAITLIGFVIGISIFILPGALAAESGPGVVLSYALASVLALFTCVAAAQLGAVLPTSGASFVAVGRLLSPFWAFVGVWMVIGGAAVAVALLGYGFADYLVVLWPGVSRTAVAVGLVVALTGLNLLGIRETVIGQTVMVGVFMLALAVFAVAGLANLDATLLTPFLPRGWSPVLSGAIAAFFSYAGFMVIVEVGGEIRDPSRNIPRALAIAFGVVLLVYTVVSLAVVGVVPWTELEGVGAPVGEAASRVLPAWVARAIVFTAVAAAASSVNVLLLGYSRDVLAMAEAGLLPGRLATLSRRHGQPTQAVLALAALSLLAVAMGGRITEYATLAVIGLLTMQILVGVVLIRLPGELPDRWDASSLTLGPRALWIFGPGMALLSAAFLVLSLLDSPGTFGVAAAYLVLGVLFYAWRGRHLERAGVDVRAAIAVEIDAISVEGA